MMLTLFRLAGRSVKARCHHVRSTGSGLAATFRPMGLKLKHLLHPLRTACLLKISSVARLNMRRVARRGERLYRNDARYNLQNVSAGLAPRMDESEDDSALLERICAAYNAAIRDESVAPKAYRATRWWEEHRRASLQPVIQALATCDLRTLRPIYRNFLRNSCSAGLIGMPYLLSNNRYGFKREDVYRRFSMSDVLYRIDYWKVKTRGRFGMCALAGPGAGNPFGVVVEGTLIGAGAEYHHYCAQRISELLDSASCQENSIVAEIGGGFGAMAWYLLRDRPGITYLNFDVPESIALASYYLIKSLPHLRFLLYGERELTKGTLASADVILMPLFTMPSLPKGSAEITFCSHVLSDISDEALATYLTDVDRMTQGCFLVVADTAAAQRIFDKCNQRCSALRLTDSTSSGWHIHRVPHWREVECLYRTDRATKASGHVVEEATCRS
jgi:hypothetical protein